MRLLSPFIVIALALLPVVAFAQWSDNFDSYPAGSQMHGQGGWAGWNGSAAATGYITNAYSRSAPNSAEIRPTTDIVHEFTGVNSEQWVFSAWCYIPTGATGEQYFILVNTYPTGGNECWSTQVLFNMTAGTVENYGGATLLPILRNQWIELRVEIDFSLDMQTIYYDNQFLHSGSWTAGYAPGGALNLAAVDLFSNAGATIYWDDLVLDRPGPSATESSTMGRVKALFR